MGEGIDIVPVYRKLTGQGPIRNAVGVRNLARKDASAGITDSFREYNSQQSSGQLAAIAPAASKDVNNIRDVLLRLEGITQTNTAAQIAALTPTEFNAELTEDQLGGVSLDEPEGGGGAPPVLDTTPPTITAKNPDNGATGVGITANIIIDFSEAMDAARATNAEFDLWKTSLGSGPGDIAMTVTLSGARVTLNPNASLEEGVQYTVRVRGGVAPSVADLAGNAMVDPDIEWSFTTIPPVITYTKVYDLSTHGTSWTEIHHDPTHSVGLRLDSTATDGTVTSHPPLINKKPRGANVLMYRVGTVAGNVKLLLMHYNGANTEMTLIAELGSILASSITTNTAGEWKEFRHPAVQNHAMVVNDTLVVKADNGSTSAMIKVRRADSDIWNKGMLMRGSVGDADQDSGRDWPHIIYV